MTTSLSVRMNLVDADVSYQTTAANYITLDLANDYLIFTSDSTDVDDRMSSEPTSNELNDSATQISQSADVTVEKLYVMDYSHSWSGSYYTYEVKGMSENKRYVFAFSFDGATASEPQLEAWDDSDHDSTALHVLGNGTPASSMVKAICTTNSLPGASWSGTAIAGSGTGRYIQLNDGNGALSSVPSGQSTQELYANVKIVVPAAYSTPASETFVLTVRYTWT